VLVLVIDTSTPAVTAGLAEVDASGGSHLLAERVSTDPRRHGELLAPAVDAALAAAGRVPSDLGAVVAGLGPGPYTGLRIGLVTAAALAGALDLPAYGVCSLDAIAHAQSTAVDAPAGEGPVLVATDARRREVYWATYDHRGRRLTGPDVGRPADVDATGCRLACGAGALLYDLGLPTGPPLFPPAAALAALAADRIAGRARPEQLTPLYLRRPDAMEPSAARA